MKTVSAIYCSARLMLACMLLYLSCCESLATSHHQDGWVHDKDINSLFKDDSESAKNNVIIEKLIKRQIDGQSNGTNETDFCSDYYISTIFQLLNSSCLDAIVNLNVANKAYAASLEAVRDIATVCRGDCGGVFLDFAQLCPEFSPHISEYLHGICLFNSHSERCAFSVTRNNGSRVYQKCFVETDSTRQCHSSCRNSLIDFRADIDCCINSFYNATYSFFQSLQYHLPNLNYSINPLLWETCGLSYPSKCPPYLFPTSAPPSTPIRPSQTPPPTPTPLCRGVENREIFSETCLDLLTALNTPSGLRSIAGSEGNTSYLCSPNCGGIYVEQCDQEAQSEEYVTLLEIFCGQSTNGYCGGVIADTYNTLLQNASKCAQPHTQACTASCSSFLNDINSELGCCTYALTVEIVSKYSGLEILDTALWTECGLHIPQRCPNPFQTGTNTHSTTSSRGNSKRAIF